MPEPEVCPKCGWYAHPDLSCDPKAGAKADALSERIRMALPFVKTTRLGYGHGVLAFVIDENTNIRFRIRSGGRLVQFEDLFYLNDLDADDIFALVEALDRIRNRRAHERSVADGSDTQVEP